MAGDDERPLQSLWFKHGSNEGKVFEDEAHGDKLYLGYLPLVPKSIMLNRVAGLVNDQGWTMYDKNGLQKRVGNPNGNTCETAIVVTGTPDPGYPGGAGAGGGTAATGGVGAGAGTTAGGTVFVVTLDDDDEEAKTREGQYNLQSQDELNRLLDKMESTGLMLLPAIGSVPSDQLNVPVDGERRIRLGQLKDGARYLADPARGGLSKLRKTVSNINNNSENLSRGREAQLEASLVKHAPSLLNWPGFLCSVTAMPGLHQVQTRDGNTVEFDAVVKVVRVLVGTVYILAELKTKTSGTRDLFKLLDKVQDVADIEPFVGKVLRPAFMVEHAGPKAMEKVKDVCRNKRVIRMVPGTGGIVPAAMAQASHKLRVAWR